jgi:hypothetical protein
MILSFLYIIVYFINHKQITATIPHNTGDITQLAAIFHIVGHDTEDIHKAATQAHITHQTIE